MTTSTTNDRRNRNIDPSVGTNDFGAGHPDLFTEGDAFAGIEFLDDAIRMEEFDLPAQPAADTND